MPRENLARKAAFLKSKLNAANLIFGNQKRPKKHSFGLSDTKTNEKTITKKLRDKIGGEVEVGSRYGKIDLLTEDSIIEVKRYKSWKHALGQVLVYGIDYPNHKKVLYLYGVSKPRKSNWDLICNTCILFDVKCFFLIEK